MDIFWNHTLHIHVRQLGSNIKLITKFTETLSSLGDLSRTTLELALKSFGEIDYPYDSSQNITCLLLWVKYIVIFNFITDYKFHVDSR